MTIPPRIAAFLSLVSLVGCVGSLDNAGEFLNTTCGDVPSSLIVPTCALVGCHGGTKPQAGLDLASPGVESRLVDQPASSGCNGGIYVPRVNPTAGVFYQKLTDAPPCGARMPLIGNPLNKAQLACVAQWVNSIIQLGGGTPTPAGSQDSGVPDDAGAPDSGLADDGGSPDAGDGG